MSKSYNIGLDIGTTSVGWAVVEKETNKVMRKGNKALWGVRLFEEATTASGRRSFRSTRRRYDRRRQRIQLLQEEFSEEIKKVDPDFFVKMRESFFWENDEENKKHPLSIKEKEMIKTYHEIYPTIYHLRRNLLGNNEKLDIRLVYLAIHHIIKYRGNFLYDNSEFNVETLNIKEKLNEVFTSLTTCEELDFSEDTIQNIDFEELQKALLNPSKNDKKELLKEILEPYFFSKEAKTSLNELIKSLIGNKFSISKLYNIELEPKIEISFNGSDFDDKYLELELALGIKIESLSSLKELYDLIFLKSLFGNRENSCLSEVMVDCYKEHEEDLRMLKEILNYDREEYRKIFRTNSKTTCLYDNYIHNHISYEDFIRDLNKSLDKVEDLVKNSDSLNNNFANVRGEMEKGTFLPRITSSSNGKYPYQLNKNELIKILENQGRYYPFLLEKVNGEYKIVKLLTFKIPYYVGPLVSKNKSEFAWMKRSKGYENVKITPYNFDEVIDKENSAEEFITKMLGHCSYLLKEPAMPTNSILYSEYKVLNELKQIRVNNERLTHSFQQRVMDEFFRKETGTLTDKKFKEYLVKSREFDMYNGELSVTGYSADNKFANKLSSYLDFYGETGFFKDTNLKLEDAEEIIRCITIFEDKDILATKIEREYPVLKPIISKIIKKKYAGWGNLSKKLLTTPYYYDEKTSTRKSIMDLMWETNDNFMQIITDDKYKFQDMIAEENIDENIEGLNYKIVKELTTSPSTKRSIWQALKVVEELVDYIGYEPDSISIEMARGDEKKQRKDDRKKYLSKLYDASKTTIDDYKKLMKELGEKSNDDLQAEKLFLYFIQEGKSLYSATPLEIDRLNEYEVDHILPRTLIKNDSIENKALVLKQENQDKAANLVLPSEFRTNENIRWWRHLKDIKLISASKFHNLVRKEYKEEEIEDFINRQLVETRQITKHVANIIQSLHKDSKIIYLPASLSRNYREKFELFKFRDLNDYHHAHDAYLAAVLGEYKRHCNLKFNYEELRELNIKLYESKKYNELRYGYVINSIDSSFEHFDSKTGEVLDIEEFKKVVENTLYRNDILISKKTEIRTGEFYNQIPLKKTPKKVKGRRLKQNLPIEKYGYYNSVNPSYMALTSINGRNCIIGVPIYLNDKQDIISFISKEKNISKEQITILKKCIPFNSEINYKGQRVLITGNSELMNNEQIKIPKEEAKKWKYALNLIFNNKNISKIKENSVMNEAEIMQQCNEIIDFLIYQKSKYPIYDDKLQKIHDNKIIYNLDLEKKREMIKRIFIMLKASKTNVNLKDIGLTEREGRITFSNIEHATIINKSVTGLRSRKYEF